VPARQLEVTPLSSEWSAEAPPCLGLDVQVIVRVERASPPLLLLALCHLVGFHTASSGPVCRCPGPVWSVWSTLTCACFLSCSGGLALSSPLAQERAGSRLTAHSFVAGVGTACSSIAIQLDGNWSTLEVVAVQQLDGLLRVLLARELNNSISPATPAGVSSNFSVLNRARSSHESLCTSVIYVSSGVPRTVEL
jgi:hypothetical protein